VLGGLTSMRQAVGASGRFGMMRDNDGSGRRRRRRRNAKPWLSGEMHGPSPFMNQCYSLINYLHNTEYSVLNY
jgi:hypothetical protein